MDFNEKDIIKDAQSGNRESFGKIVDKYKDKIYGISLALTKDKLEAEEIAQQVFIKLFKNIGKFNYRSSFSTWLYRLAHNTFYDYTRKTNRRSSRAIPIEKTHGLDVGDNPYEKLNRNEIRRIVFDALGEIPHEFSLAVIYYDIDGRSYEEISQIIEKPMGTVKSRIYRGRELLREKLGNIFGFENV